MPVRCASFDPQLGYMPAVPEPFWYRSWRTWFTDTPSCYRAGCTRKSFFGEVLPMFFKNRQAYDTHYILRHLEEDENSSC